MSDKKFLVPHDFTAVAETAVNHAVKTAEVVGGEVCLLHVVTKAEDVDGARGKLNAEADKIKAASNVNVTAQVRIGNIFEDIGDTASELGAELIFMGTHGASGWQKLTGSHALKVITNSSIPFVVVQKQVMKEGGYDDIVTPMDLHKESKQKLSIVVNMAKFFNSRVHIVTPLETDEYLKNALNNNIAWAKKYLAENGIESTATVLDRGGFDKEIIKFAADKDADMISIMNLSENSLMGMFGSSYEQNLITNTAQIPVMIVNPLQTHKMSGGVMFQ